MKNYIFDREKDSFLMDDELEIFFDSNDEVYKYLKCCGFTDEFIESNFYIMKAIRIILPEEIPELNEYPKTETKEPVTDVNYDLERLYEWVMDENRGKSITAFTSGIARNIASEFEFRLFQKEKATPVTDKYPVIIKCPACDTVQAAIVENTIPFGTFIHHCVKCEYVIMESEWNEIPAYTMYPVTDNPTNAEMSKIAQIAQVGIVTDKPFNEVNVFKIIDGNDIDKTVALLNEKAIEWAAKKYLDKEDSFSMGQCNLHLFKKMLTGNHALIVE